VKLSVMMALFWGMYDAAARWLFTPDNILAYRAMRAERRGGAEYEALVEEIAARQAREQGREDQHCKSQEISRAIADRVAQGVCAEEAVREVMDEFIAEHEAELKRQQQCEPIHPPPGSR
jgi:hypothetical protein